MRKPTREDETDRYVDIRVDDNPEPLKELRRIYGLWERAYLLWPRLKNAENLAKAGETEKARIERQRALGPYERDIRANPNDVKTLKEFAIILASPFWGIHDVHRALELAERAAKLAPNDAGSLNVLANVLIWSNLDLDRVIELLERLIKLEPDQDTQDSYRHEEAEAYFQKGNVAKAKEIETELVRKHPDESDYAESLKRFEAAQRP